MFNFKVLFIVGLLVALAAAQLGAPSKLTGDDLKKAEESLNGYLTKLAAGDGPTFTVVELTDAEKQVIAGFKYTFNAKLKSSDGDVKTCKIVVIDQGWKENSSKISVECDGETVEGVF